MNDEQPMTMEASIRHQLVASLDPTQLDIINESHLHQGHAGASGSGESHFRIAIKAPALQGLSRVEQHRRINGALAVPFARGLHALAIKVLD